MTSESNIRSAHSRAIGGQRKRCQKGKNCSAACIERNDACLVELPLSPAKEVARLRDHLHEQGDMKPKMGALSSQMRDDLREKVYDGVRSSIRSGLEGQGKETYNSWRDKAIEFNKEIVRQGLENSIKPINVPVSVEKVNKVIGNYNNARLALFKDMEKALADGDPDKFERIERRRERMRDKIGIRIGESSVDQKNLDTIAFKGFMDAQSGFRGRLIKLAKGGNKKAYDKLSDKLTKLNDWASRRFGIDIPVGSIWELYKSSRTNLKVQKISDEAWMISQSLQDLAREGRRDQYNKLENKLARIESILKSKFEPDRAVFEKGKLWARTRERVIRAREQEIRGQRNSLLTFRDVIRELQADRKASSIDGVVKAKKVNWLDILSIDSTLYGRGSYGSFAVVREEKLAEGIKGMFPGGVGVKAGDIGLQEVYALESLGNKGLAPRLVAAKIGGQIFQDRFRRGLVAMEFIKGSMFDSTYGKEESFLKSMAAMHRSNFSHNDLHGNNAIIEPSGKVRFLDFGLARVSSKSALAEALASTVGGNRQLPDSVRNHPIIQDLKMNLYDVEDYLRQEKGFTPSEIRNIVNTGIRKELSYFNQGPWGSINQREARKMIEILYNGVL